MDDRGVSTVVGVVFLLGFLVILLSVYQAQVVPLQNRQAEFDHSNEVQNQMVSLRNAILTAKAEGRTTFAEVQLGTSYPNRVLAVNPPPPSGTLRTTDPRQISVSASGAVPDLCPSGGTIQTRSLRFEPHYNAYDNAPAIVYENTVLYLDFGDRQIPLTDQQLVHDGGDTIDLVPLNTSLYEQGTRRISVEPIPGNVRDNELTNADITLPTNLSESTWEELLSGQLPASDVSVTNGELTLHVSGDVSVACSPLGLNDVPAGGRRQSQDLSINPAGPNDVALESTTRSGGTLTVTFNNTADRDTNITGARMPFVNVEKQNVQGSSLDPYDISAGGTVRASNYEIGDELRIVDPAIQLPGNDTQTNFQISFDNAGSDFNNGGFVVLTLRFENGATGTYFLDVPS
ncbi:MAG: hypothetical protein ABEJ89_04145 [Haloarculaceae archaeon]